MFFRYNLFTILWALLILMLTLLPGKSMPYTNIWESIAFDKIAHFGVYAILTFLAIIGFLKQHSFRQFRIHAVRNALVFSISYGIILELLQSFSPDRSIEFEDIVANVIGCAIGYFLFWIIYKT